jgi:hypothetical protein
VTVFEPVCTCAVTGILGCAKHPVTVTISRHGGTPTNPPLTPDNHPGIREPEPPCDCPPGWQHEPDCHIVTGKPAERNAGCSKEPE